MLLYTHVADDIFPPLAASSWPTHSLPGTPDHFDIVTWTHVLNASLHANLMLLLLSIDLIWVLKVSPAKYRFLARLCHALKASPIATSVLYDLFILSKWMFACMQVQLKHTVCSPSNHQYAYCIWQPYGHPCLKVTSSVILILNVEVAHIGRATYRIEFEICWCIYCYIN